MDDAIKSESIRKLTILTAFLVILMGIECKKETPTVIHFGEENESVSSPSAPFGVGIVESGDTVLFTSGNANSNLGHEIEYCFIWGDGERSDWSSIAEAYHSWNSEGVYILRSMARCRVHTEIESDSSEMSTVLVASETVTSPAIPSGPAYSCVGQTVVYTTSGAHCNFSHSVEYQFDWGDGSRSEWLAVGSASHIWSTTGIHAIVARSRCAIDTLAISGWSPELSISTLSDTWSINYELPGLTGDYNLSKTWRTVYVRYDGPPAQLVALVPFVYGYGGGGVEECSPGVESTLYFILEMNFAINQLPRFTDFIDLGCWLGYPYRDFDCGGMRTTEDQWTGPQYLAPGDSLMVALTTCIFVSTPGCELIVSGREARVDSVHLRLELECNSD